MMNVTRSFKALLVIILFITAPRFVRAETRQRGGDDDASSASHRSGQSQPQGARVRPVTATELHTDTAKLIDDVFFDGKEKAWVESRYKEMKIGGQTFAEAIKAASEGISDEAKLKPVSDFIAQLQIRIGSKERFDKAYDYLKPKMAALTGQSGESAGDPQTEFLTKMLWWTLHVDTSNPERSKIKKPETEKFNPVMIAALKKEKEVTTEINRLTKLANEGNQEAKAKLRGNSAKAADAPENKYAITGPGAVKSLSQMPSGEVAKYLGALAWKSDDQHAYVDMHGPNGANIRFWLGKDKADIEKAAKAFSNPEALAKLASWNFSDKAHPGVGQRDWQWKDGKLVPGRPGQPAVAGQPVANPPVAGPQGPGASPVSTGLSGTALVTARCNGCHSETGPKPLSGYSDAQKVQALTRSRDPMPRGQTISTQERNDLIRAFGGQAQAI